MASSRLFEPLTVGRLTLKHRVGMCPLTRFRASDDHVPLPIVEEYYAQRASVPGTLLISEGTFISPTQGGFRNVPGIYNDAQISAWRKVTDAVHAKGSYIYCQLWALGRTGNTDVAEEEKFTITSSSDICVDSFDGVELHGANGYLIDQFIQDTCNQRTDEYGGTVQNRSRFAVEAVQAVVDAVGPDRTGIRFSPWSTYNSMRMDDPIPQFSDVIKKLNPLKLAYLHLVESRIAGNADVESFDKLGFAMDLWDGPLVLAGGSRPDSALRLVDEELKNKDVVVAFGRLFISTPDLPFRIKANLELNKYNRDSFYTAKDPKGYIDYEFSEQYKKTVAVGA